MNRTGKQHARRSLRFDTFDHIMADIHRLVPAYKTLGNWSLGQICMHLSGGFVGSLSGFDLRNHRIKRTLFRHPLLWFTLTMGIPENYLVDVNLTPVVAVDLDQAVLSLAQSIERYQRHTGRLHAHPLFGAMPRKTWDRVHCVHSAHHLSFVIPG